MNRNQMYDYLKTLDFLEVGVIRYDKKTYSMRFVRRNEIEDVDVIFDFGYVTHVDEIVLCPYSISIIGNTGTMRVEVKYNEINEFEVKGYENVW